MSEDELPDSRQCYICHDVDPCGDEEGWVSACRCSGSLGWAHQECLLVWVSGQNRLHPTCPTCYTLLMVEPDTGPLEDLVVHFNKKVLPHLTFWKQVSIRMILMICVRNVSSMVFLYMVFGEEEALKVLHRLGPNYLIQCLWMLLIAEVLLLVDNLPWEIPILRVLRKGSKVPILRRVLPSEEPEGTPVETDPGRNTWFFLPFIAKIVGELFFSSVKSNKDRILVGGLTFIVVRGIFFMWYVQKQMLRRGKKRIVPFGSTL